MDKLLMKNDAFHSVSFWKSAVMTMRENAFFELMRSVFGKIKTPFNKQHLVDELEKFLLREDIQKTITSYIDENDAKIIAAVSLFNEPLPEQLGSFFDDEYSYAHFHDIIVNMEERFILYRSSSNCLALNPVLKPVLLPFTEDVSPLFPACDSAALPNNITLNATMQTAETESSVSGCQTVVNDLLIAGLLSFASQENNFFISERNIRKRVIESGKKSFPGIDLDLLVSSMLALGLFYIDENKLIHDKKRINDFIMLSPRERSEYYAAALYVSMNELPDEISYQEILLVLFQKKIREAANLIHGFLNSLDDSLYARTTLKRIIELCKVHEKVRFDNEALLIALEKTGLIVTTEVGCKKSDIINHVSPNAPTTYEKPVITMDSGTSILVYPEIDFSDAIKLASVMNICETGSQIMTPVVRFELNKDSAVRAFDNNISADEIIELLNRLSSDISGDNSNHLSANDAFVWNLKDWEKRHKNVSLKKGVILKLSEEHRYLIETVKLKKMIRETLADGLYLLDENAIEDAADALHDAGIDIIAQNTANTISKFPEALSQKSFSKYFSEPTAGFEVGLLPIQADSGDSNVVKGEQASVLIEKYRKILKKMPLSDPERTELSARIDRRLILCETQLKEANIRYEKLEARHMDYAGKQNVAKQAISQQSPVEIVWPGSSTAGGRKTGQINEEKIFGV
ncbi:MAG: hypothetical protein FWC97_07215, partial [Treponema sp.]|nr:hypothetical protein [Treponema sp.]